MTEEERYKQIANDKQVALDESEKVYNDMLNKNTQYSNTVNDYLNQYQQTQNDLYDKQTAHNIELQNQNKEKAQKEYEKEAIASKNAYYDFINPYGVQREIEAQNGLNRSGYGETTKSQAWTTQQNRTAQAKAKLADAKLQFDNAINEARLNNDTLKAQLALQMLEQKQNEMLRSLNYETDVTQQKLSNSQNLNSEYYNRYNNVWSQVQQENAAKEAARQWEAEQAENQRQFNEKMAYQKERDKVADSQWQQEYNLSKARYSNSTGTSGGNSNSKVSGVYLDDDTLVEGGKEVAPTGNNSNIKIVQIASLNPNALSSTAAKNYYNSNIAGRNLNFEQLVNILNSGRGILSDKDEKLIANTYKEVK